MTPRNRTPGALEVRISLSIDEEDSIDAEDHPSNKMSRSLRESRVDQERQVVGLPAQHHQPGRIVIGLGAWRGTAATTCGESSINGRGNGVRKSAGLATGAFR